jgi:capsid protein
VFIFQFCRPSWRAFIEAAVLAGQLDARDYQANRADYLAVEWHTPKWAWVDPEKDVKAEVIAIRAGLKSRGMSINETGQDEEEVDRQIARDNERADELELVLDSDPRRTDARGAQKVEDASTEGGAEGSAPSQPSKTPVKSQIAKPPTKRRGKESKQ